MDQETIFSHVSFFCVRHCQSLYSPIPGTYSALSQDSAQNLRLRRPHVGLQHVRNRLAIVVGKPQRPQQGPVATSLGLLPLA